MRGFDVCDVNVYVMLIERTTMVFDKPLSFLLLLQLIKCLLTIDVKLVMEGINPMWLVYDQ